MTSETKRVVLRSESGIDEMRGRFNNSKRLLIVGASVAGLMVLAFVLIVLSVGRTKGTINGDQVLQAIRQYVQTHRPLPRTVTFSQLMAEGYLGTNVLKEFGASEVTVYLHPEGTSFLMDALMPDGTHTTLMSDGSVQAFSNSRFEEGNGTNGTGETSGHTYP